MATTVAASNCVLRSSQLNSKTYGSKPKATITARIGFRNQTVSHEGPRLLNTLNELHMRNTSKLSTIQVRGEKLKNRNGAVIICGLGMKLIFVSSEVGPWSKTGGLGDVLGGLPPAMAANGNRVMTVSPRYDQYKDAWDTEVVVELKVGDKTEKVRFICGFSKRFGGKLSQKFMDLLLAKITKTINFDPAYYARLLWKHQEF